MVAQPAGVDLIRRRSGGGAVWVDDQMVWVDVIVPHTHRSAARDVGRAMWIVGEMWAAAIVGSDVHRGSMVNTEHSGQICFAGLGPGEVSIGGRKVVGISQRRSREGALFQCGALLSWDPGPLCEAHGLDRRVAVELRTAAAPVPSREAIDTAIDNLVALVS